MSDANNLWAERDKHIRSMIREMLDAYKPDLARATGALDATRYPTPTGNAPGGYTPAAHTHPWSDITSTPTTLAGYGITDAQPLDSDLTAIAALSTTSYGRGFLTQADAAAARSYIGAGTGSGTVTSVDITAPAAGITATGGPITSSGSITLALANDLAALEGLGSTGLAARTATDTWAQRTITGTSARISVTNGGGVAGNPTIDIDTSYVGQSSITTLGTIATGTWHGTAIAADYGGTGQASYTTGDLLYASGATALSKLAGVATGNALISGGVGTAPSWGKVGLTTHVSGTLGLANGGTNADLSATGGAGQYLKQATAGAAITVGTIPYGDLTYSGLTTGQVLRATGASAAAFGALDLANSSAVTGVLPAANGGTGVNNSTRTLTVSTNGGTLDFTAASSTLTIPTTGTAALLGRAQTFSADQTIASTLDSQQLTRIAMTSGSTGYGLRFWDGTTDYGSFQCLSLGGATAFFFSANRQYDGSAWQQLNSRLGDSLILSAGMSYNAFAAASSTPVVVFGVTQAGVATHTLNDAVTNTAPNLLLLRHNTSGTPAASFGLTVETDLDSSTTNNRTAATDVTTWATATDASRKALRVHSIYDTAARETYREEASGSAAKIGFLGAAAVVRQNITGVHSGTLGQLQTVVANLLTGLANLGLITDSTT